MNKPFASVVAGLACVFSAPAQSARQPQAPDAQHRILELLEQQHAVLQQIKELLGRHQEGGAKHGEHDVTVVRTGDSGCCCCCGKSDAKQERAQFDDFGEKAEAKPKPRAKVETKVKPRTVVMHGADGKELHGAHVIELGGTDGIKMLPKGQVLQLGDGKAFEYKLDGVGEAKAKLRAKVERAESEDEKSEEHGKKPRTIKIEANGKPHTIVFRGGDGDELHGAHVIQLDGQDLKLLPKGGAVELKLDGDGHTFNLLQKGDADGKTGIWKALTAPKAKKGGEDKDDDDDDDEKGETKKVETKRVEVAPVPATPKKPKKSGVGLRVV